MSAPDLRPYQIEVIADFHRAVGAGERRIMLVAPTGSGKTVMAADIIKSYSRRTKNVLVLSHRREITVQTSQKLYSAGIAHGIIQAGFPSRRFEWVQVASVQTLTARSFGAGTQELPPADLLVIDEAHHTPAASWRKIIEAYPNAVVLGLTATPCRGDGRGLGGIFEKLIECPQVGELVELGHLVKTRVYAPTDPDLKGIRTQAGDWAEAQLAERMDRPQLIGDIVTHWHKFGERRMTVAFAVNVAHSLHLRDEFLRSGVRAEHLDGATPKPERDATLARLASGELELVTNCMVLTEGWDLPGVGCCILARPTKKMGLYRQMIGRVLRPAPGKTDAIVLDHSGAVFRHGFAEDPVAWTLDPERHASSPAHAARCESQASRLIECSQCGAVRTGGKPCSSCGFLPQRPAREVDIADGELGMVDATRRALSGTADPVTQRQWHAMLVAMARERGYKPGWAAHKFKEKFGAWPPYGAAPQPIDPTPEVRSWVRSRMIAYAKAHAA